MSNESIKNPEPLAEVIKVLLYELGHMNIKADLKNEEEFPLIVIFNGKLDSTEEGNASDEVVSGVLDRMNRKYNHFDFTQDKPGTITVSPKK